MEGLIEKAHAYLDNKGCKSMGQKYTAFKIEKMLADFAQQQQCNIGAVIERSDIKLPKLHGDLKHIEFKVEDVGKVKHTWLIFHGMRTFADKEPFKVHLGRNIL